MVQVELRLGGLIEVRGRQVAVGQTFALLDAVEAARSVSGAARRLGLSYRTAWDRVEALQAAFGQPLVVKTKGHGSALSPAGLRLRDALGAVLRTFEAPLSEAQASLARQIGALVGDVVPALRAAVSHDPLLLALLAGLAEPIDAATTGSAEAAARLIAGEVELAGLHFGTLAFEPPPGSVFCALSHDDRFVVTPLLRREQGLMLAAGNPLGIGSLADLVATQARLINRQKGSGTRLWLDRLLAQAGLAAARLRGYADEEFTHQAVAAVVASGAADAGMGVRPAAEQFGLDFVPLGHETYFIVARRGLEARIEGLRTAAAQRAQGTGGYAPP